MKILEPLVVLFMTVFQKCDEVRAAKAQVDQGLGDVVQYRDGKILLAFFIPVTNHDENGKCTNEFKYIHMVEQVNMMIEEINGDDSVLSGVELGTIMINTCFGGFHTLKKLVLDVISTHLLGRGCSGEACNSEQRILAGVVGASRSSVSMDLAKVLQVFSVPQISYWSTNPELSDKAIYKYFFRTVPPDNYQTLAMVRFIKEMGWNYVSLVYNDDAYGIRGYTELSQGLKEEGICVAVALPINDAATGQEYETLLRQLMERKNSKAVIVFAVRDTVQKLLTKAMKVDSEHSLIWIASDAWTALTPSDNEDGSFAEALHGTVGISLKFSSVDEVQQRMRGLTIQNYTGDQTDLNPWWTAYVNSTKNCTSQESAQHGRRKCETNESVSDYTGIKNDIQDAVKIYIRALDSYHRDVCGNRSGLCPELAKTAGTNKVVCDLYEYLKNVTFETDDGKTFAFDENQDGPAVYDIVAFDKNTIKSDIVLEGWKVVGTYDIETGIQWTSSLPKKTNTTKSICSTTCQPGQAKILLQQSCCWHCQTCSNREYAAENSCEECVKEEMPDENKTRCVPIPVRQMEYNSPESIFCIALGALGLLCTLIVSVLYWKNRETAIVRASGRELCFFVLVGVFITLLNSFSITAPPSTFSCALTRIILSMGPACMYAGMLMKTFRVVFIFQSKGILSTRTKAYLEPAPLILLTLGVVSVQIVILVVWMAVHAPSDMVNYYEDDNSAFRSCRHLLHAEMFIGLAYPFFIIIICTVLATINRNVPTGFRETFFVGFTMYTTCVTWTAFQPLFFTSSNDKPRQLTTMSAALSISAITVLSCLFCPRCYAIVKHPELNTSESVMSHTARNHPSKSRLSVPCVSGQDNQACSTSGR